ncbi:MAG: hypothetical protein EAZ61_14795, partial [Oscillatoriales cyanobacterium]
MNLTTLRPIVRRFARIPARVVPTSVALGGFFAVMAAQMPVQAELFSIDVNRLNLDRSQENYEQCASQLLNHDLDQETIALACATAFTPTELAACVSEIDDATDISAADAIDACREVRRPLD